MSEKRKNFYIRTISLLSFFSIVFCVATIVYAQKANQYRFMAEVSYQRAVSELCESLDNITVNLQKSLYTGTSEKMKQTANELKRESAIAKVCLSQLTDENINSDEIYKFLSQVGAFTLFTTQNKITAKQQESLRRLYNYSDSLCKEMNKIRSGCFDGSISFSSENSSLQKTEENAPELFGDAMQDFDQSLTDYPTLIYDGPFADNLLNKKSVFLKNKSEKTKKEASSIAARVMNTDEKGLRQLDDVNSQIELYSFSKGDKSISITKKGGYVATYSDPRQINEETISPEEAVSRGRDYLSILGFDSMESTYYSVYDGVCTINFAFCVDGIICYPDLIKVGIALDTGETVSVDSTAYLMNHTERTAEEITVSLEAAIKSLSSSLNVISTKQVFIPLDTGKEAFCHEIRCKDTKSDQEVLVYIDCRSGKEQDILILLYSDNGILTK